MRRKRHETERGAKGHLVAESAGLAQRQGDARRVDQRRVAHISDVGQRDPVAFAAVLHDQRVALVNDFIDEVEHQLAKDEISEHGHEYRSRERHDALERVRPGDHQGDHDHRGEDDEPHDRKGPLVQRRQSRRYPAHRIVSLDRVESCEVYSIGRCERAQWDVAGKGPPASCHQFTGLRLASPALRSLTLNDQHKGPCP